LRISNILVARSSSSRPFGHSVREKIFCQAIVVVSLAYAAWTLAVRRSGAVEFDAVHIYLPFAREFMANAGGFLASEKSIWVAPLAYLYPALLGAEPATIQWANIGLYLALIVIGYRAGSLLHSRPAGAVVAILLATSPAIKPFIPTVLTEPPYLFLVGVWLWAMMEGWKSGAKGWWILGGVALGLAILTRPTYTYFPPIAIAAASWVLRTETEARVRHRWSGLALCHGVAMALAMIAIARNAALFDYPSISTGAGAALYFGSNPATLGYDYGYLGLVFDDGSVTLGKHHLSIEADRLLRGVALSALGDTPLAGLARLYAEKLAAFLFVTSAETTGAPELLRAWRIGVLAFAGIGWVAIASPFLRTVLASLLVYQMLIHLPLMYNFRYSVDALDVPLAFLAGAGVASSASSLRQACLTSIMIGVAMAAGVVIARYQGDPMPQPERAPHFAVWRARFDPPRTGPSIEVQIVDAPRLFDWDHVVLTMVASLAEPAAGRCRSIAVAFRRNGQSTFSVQTSRRVALGKRAAPVTVAGRVPLGIVAEGDLRIVPDCDPGVSLQLHEVRVDSIRFATYYRERSLGLPGSKDIEMSRQ